MANIRQIYIPKIIAIVSLIMLIVAVFIAWQNPTKGYELNIYSTTPIVTWIFVFLAMLGGASIIIQQVISKRFQTSQIWLLGFLILLLSHFSFLCVPYIRNYFTWGGDNLSHWGLVKDILNTGHFSAGNYYPITHCLLSQLILITKLPLQLVCNISTPLISSFFIMSTYLLSTEVLPKKEQQLIATTIVAMVMIEGGYHVFLMPNGWSIFLLPLLFYFYFKYQSNRIYMIAFFILLVMYPFFHPLTSLMIAVMFILLFLIGLFSKSFSNRGNKLTIFVKYYSPLIFGIIEFGILILWITRFEFFKSNIKTMWENIFSRSGEAIGNIETSLSKVSIHGFDLGVLYVKLYGADTILIILSLISLILAFRLIKKTNQNSYSFAVVDVGVMFLAFGLIYLLYLAGLFGLTSIAADRTIYYTMALTPELAAIAIFGPIQKIKNIIIKYILVIILLAVPSALSLRQLYYSPYIVQDNLQVTAKDMVGFEWMITEKDFQIGTLNILTPPSRFFDAILSSQTASQRSDNYDVQFSDHFGYNEYTTLGEQYSGDKYASITESDKIIYSTVWKDVGRFNDSDFTKLDNDNTVSKIYSNGGMDVYYIQVMQNIYP